MIDPKRFVLSGAREIGKTSLLLQLIDRAAAMGAQPRGVISPAVFENGKKIGIDLMNVSDRSICRLADLNEAAANSNIPTIHWTFHPDSLEMGNSLLAQSVPCDLLLVDELGPIELEKGQGWQAGLAAIQSRQYQIAVIVIRPSLVENALSRWPDAEVLTLTEKSDAAQTILLQKILANLSPNFPSLSNHN